MLYKIWKGRQERIRRGKAPGGNIPYGYIRDENEFQICQKEAEIVGLIFDLNSSGEPSTCISGILNERGYVRRNGKSWTPRQVSAILSRRELYEHGILYYGSAKGENKELILVCDQTTYG